MYYSPFARVEKGQPRTRDIRDITSPLNANHPLTPQILIRDVRDFDILTDRISQLGFRSIDLNLGCPFPPLVKKGCGAGMLVDREKMVLLAEAIKCRSEISFSIKMRLGLSSPDEWESVADIIEDTPLSHITVHPRTASQQYGGTIHMEAFGKILQSTLHKVIYNGDLHSPEDIERIREAFPELSGVMIGRGLLARPSIIEEWRQGSLLPKEQRMSRLIELHRNVFEHYAGVLCGDTQILSKIKPFWDYLSGEIGQKAYKRIKKASSMPKYLDAVAEIPVQ